MPADRARYIGEAVVLVVAETATLAADAAELAAIEWEPLPPVTGARAAMRPGVPPVWPDRERNLALTCEVGGGSVSGRLMRLVSITVGEAVEQILARGKAIAAHILQPPREAAIAYADGVFTASGGASVTLWDVARAAETLDTLPTDLRGPLAGVSEIVNRAGGDPHGSHVCEVEADPETGHVRIVAWTGVDDAGRAAERDAGAGA